MSKFMNSYFGPLSKDWCVYFLILTIIFFVTLVLTLFGNIYYIFKNSNKLKMNDYVSGILILFNIFIAYFVNRLLYTMCTKSLI